VETFVPALEFTQDPGFATRRAQALRDLDLDQIDAPIVHLIAGFVELPFCFTLQCCYGHFVHEGDDDHTLARLAGEAPSAAPVLYRIAYVAWCIDAGADGRRFRDDLRGLASGTPDLVQFGSATWFREWQVNSYVLQAEPERFAELDKTPLAYAEALRVQAARDEMFVRLSDLLDDHRRALARA
jgi:hypothetical protein